MLSSIVQINFVGILYIILNMLQNITTKRIEIKLILHYIFRNCIQITLKAE